MNYDDDDDNDNDNGSVVAAAVAAADADDDGDDDDENIVHIDRTYCICIVTSPLTVVTLILYDKI